MDKNAINLRANAKTDPCISALERQEDSSLLAYRLEKIYELFGAEKEDVFVFTSSGAEAVNQVLWSVFLKISRTAGKCHFITSQVEDAPTLQMMKRLEELGCFVKIAPVNEKGEIDVEKLAELINPRTALISITMAQGSTGVIQPVEEIGNLCRERGVLLHLDGSYAAGKYAFSLSELKPDYFTFSGDKIHSLASTGGLFAKKQAPLVPLILGGNSLRGGPLDTASILSLCSACAQASLFVDAMALEVARLKSYFERELQKAVPNIQILFKDSLKLPNTTVVSFSGVHQEALHYFLKKAQIETEIGGDFSQSLSSLLTASHIGLKTANSALSFSLSRMTTEEDLKTAILKISETVAFLRSISEGIENTSQIYIPSPIFKKLREKIHHLRFCGSFTSEEAEKKGMRLITGQEEGIAFHWLVDPTDGVIADVKFQAFGPSVLLGAAEIASELIIRKNYSQASRISADLIDQHARDKKEIPSFPKEAHPFLNQVVSAIDTCVQQCQDIPCPSFDYETTPIEWDSSENPNGIPGWEEFPKEKKMHLIEEVIDKEIRPYVELDAGGVKVLDLKENQELLISYQGSCTTCHSATGSTLTAIQQILRARLHPMLTVIPEF